MNQASLDFTAPPLAQARAVGEAASQLALQRAERETNDFSQRADGRALGSIYASLRRRQLIHVVGTCARRKGHGGQGGSIYALGAGA